MANTVNITVGADTAKAEQNIGGLSGKIGSLAKPVAVASAAVTGMAVAAVKLGDEFKEAENTIRAGTGATGKDLEALTKSFEEVFKGVPNDSQAVSTAIADLNTELGLQGKELEIASKAFLDLSRITGKDVAPMIKSVSDAMVQFGVPANQVEYQLDQLTVASQAVGVPIEQLSAMVGKFAPQLKQMGLSMGESTAMIASMEAAGLETTRMFPGLNTAMKKLTEAGVEDMATGLQDVIQDLKDTEDETLALSKAQAWFGASAGIRFLDAIKTGALDFDELHTAMAEGEGVVASLGAETLTTADKFDIMKNQVKGALAPIGGFATEAGPLIMLIPALTTAVTGLSTVVPILSAKMALLNLSMGPILLAVVGIAAAITAGIVIWKNWDKVVEGSAKIWRGLKTAIIGVLDGIWGAIKFYLNLWIGGFNKLIGGINKIGFDVPDWVPAIGGKGFNINVPEIPKLAQGGIVNKPTLAVIGEAGPEAVVPLRGRGNAMGGITVNVHMPAGGTVILDDEQTAQKFGDFITNQVRQVLRTQGAF
jgi:TP901 family phage tail tape measure protein